MQCRRIPAVGIGRSVVEHDRDGRRKTKWVEMQEEHGQTEIPNIGNDNEEAPEFLDRGMLIKDHDFEADEHSGRGKEARGKTAARGVEAKEEKKRGSSISSVGKWPVEAPEEPYMRCGGCRVDKWEDLDEVPCLECAGSWSCWKSDKSAGEGKRRGRFQGGVPTEELCEGFGADRGKPNSGGRIRLCPY